MNKRGYSILALILLVLSILIIFFAVYFFYTKQTPPKFYGGCDSNGFCF